MVWSKDLEESYKRIQAIRAYMLDCPVCDCPITSKEHDENEGMCDYCSGKEKF
jgi:rRNA maturation endonuclease Nob1